MPPNSTIYDDAPAKNTTNMNSVGDVTIYNSEENVESPGCCKKCSDKIIGTLENVFAKVGFVVGSNPWKVIIISVILCLLCTIGVMEYYAENRAEKLWVAEDSISLEHQKWVSDRYPTQSRVVNVILESSTSNILTPTGMQESITVDEKVKGIYKNDTSGLAWDDICYKMGVGANAFCNPSTILSIWKYNYTHIKSLTQSEILDDINNKGKVGKLNLNLIIGDPDKDGSGRIVSAKALKFTYFLKNQQVYVKSKGNLFDEKGEKWEKEFSKQLVDGIVGSTKVYSYSNEKRREDGGDLISGDLQFLFVGYILIIIYLVIMLGQCSRLKHKVWLALDGVLCIGLAIGVSYGLCSAFQLDVSPVHSVLPFLLLGIGVDDVFVIVQNWDNVGGASDKSKTVAEKISETMKTAGVSILVTSFTDICAFLIGATTILPALRSFCIFAGLGILAIFLLTCTLFVACLALDAQRQRDRYDACLCCMKVSDDYQASECSEKNFLQTFMEKIYSKILLSVPGRIVILGITCGVLAGGSYGLSLLKQDFDPDWFLPPDSYTVYFNNINKKYFSNEGIRVNVYIGEVDYFKYQKKVGEIYNILDKNIYVLNGTVKSWHRTYVFDWLPITNYTLDADGYPTSEADFYASLDKFLTSPMGSRYVKEFNRKTDGMKKITSSRMEFTHTRLIGSSDQIKGMDSVQEDLNNNVIGGFTPFSYTRFYVNWETNKVISEELTRNLIIAGCVVFLVTLFLITDILVSFLVVTCVGFTLVNIAGYMHFWGLTVDTVTTIQLILAIGLSVDYSAHIGHGFMTSQKPSRKERAADSLTEIGPAVVHGGMSTFLAFVFLAGSKSYIFSTFFKLFFLVVVFGVFHGLAYLPVVLSLVGPKPYSTRTQDENKEIEMSKSPANENVNSQPQNALENLSYEC